MAGDVVTAGTAETDVTQVPEADERVASGADMPATAKSRPDQDQAPAARPRRGKGGKGKTSAEPSAAELSDAADYGPDASEAAEPVPGEPDSGLGGPDARPGKGTQNRSNRVAVSRAARRAAQPLDRPWVDRWPRLLPTSRRVRPRCDAGWPGWARPAAAGSTRCWSR